VKHFLEDESVGGEEMVSDGWLIRRAMKLTCFEKRLINSPQHARHTEQTALALLEHVSLPTQPRCLEIGCGQGALARLLVERYNARVVASELSVIGQRRIGHLCPKAAIAKPISDSFVYNPSSRPP
jgi:hypothetical protein